MEWLVSPQLTTLVAAKVYEQMAAFNVTSLSNFGYPETTRLVDPMDPRFRAKPYRYFSAAEVDDTLESFSRMSIYAEVEEIEETLDEYWAQG